MLNWRIHSVEETASTNEDARAGRPGDVFTAAYQTAGRGRLDHKWISPRGENLMMSVVLDVANLDPIQVATLPLVAGVAVMKALETWIDSARLAIKWPNDVWVEGRKIAGILCERVNDCVIVGLGVNVLTRQFPDELRTRATSLALACRDEIPHLTAVRDAVLAALSSLVAQWRTAGFASVKPDLDAHDALKGHYLTVRQTDNDAERICGFCDGIAADGALLLNGRPLYAGEAHIEHIIKIAP